ncbi:MAG TPA: glutamate formimidoyltransferase [Miltoncostaeaceae bacterium]|nr:glutamate formimidoyltransferase [Miltoncostaeaceae bacterium]
MDVPLPRPTVLAVPNVSEGRDGWVVDALQEACALPGVRVVGRHSDADHDRTVFTLVGHPMAVQDALVNLAAACVDHIDLRRHRGVHPRVGALDVCPIVAVRPEDQPLAEEVALGLADRLGFELNLPVFLYGTLVADPTRNRPFHFRRGGLDGLADAIEGERLVPDAGPARLHPTAGAVLVGVRPPLIAWNVELADGTLADARAIADRVREAGGGLPGLRALGLYLPARGVAQVSMNLEDHRVTPPARAVAAVRREADRLGVAVGDSELVGMIPGEALRGVSPAALGLRRLTPAQVLEARVPALRPPRARARPDHPPYR